jgi:spore maturation protein SpmB
MAQLAKYLILAGILLVIAGLILYFFGNKFSWLGRLPGDIRVEKENFHFFFPITTMIIISVILSLIVYFIRKFF